MSRCSSSSSILTSEFSTTEAHDSRRAQTSHRARHATDPCQCSTSRAAGGEPPRNTLSVLPRGDSTASQPLRVVWLNSECVSLHCTSTACTGASSGTSPSIVEQVLCLSKPCRTAAARERPPSNTKHLVAARYAVTSTSAADECILGALLAEPRRSRCRACRPSDRSARRAPRDRLCERGGRLRCPSTTTSAADRRACATPSPVLGRDVDREIVAGGRR